MFIAPGSSSSLERGLTREAAQRIAANWWVLLVNGLLLIVVGVLIFSIDWSVRSLASFIGALFIFEGLTMAFTRGIDRDARGTNVVSGVLSAAAGVVIVAWPGPGLTVAAIFLGAWLIVTGTLAISAAFAARGMLPNWWMLLLIGLIEVPLGVLALADPGTTLAALVTAGGIWAVAVGISRVVLAFEVRHLPEHVDEAWTSVEGGAADDLDAGRRGPQVPAHAAS